MNYVTIKHNDIANGLGVRTSLFVAGCTHHCKGCFNEVAQDFNAGQPFNEDTINEILESLKPSHIQGLTLLGGEPMEPQNQIELYPLLRKVRETYPSKNIWIYSGYSYEELINDNSRCHTNITNELLSYADVLVDGEFIQEQYDITLKFRGSRNQRIIDLKASLTTNNIVLYELN